MPEVCRIKSLIVTGWIGGTSSSAIEPSGFVVSIPTFVPAKRGMYFDTGSVSASLPSSISIIASTLVIGLVMEWMAKIVSGVMDSRVLTSRTPNSLK